MSEGIAGHGLKRRKINRCGGASPSTSWVTHAQDASRYESSCVFMLGMPFATRQRHAFDATRSDHSQDSRSHCEAGWNGDPTHCAQLQHRVTWQPYMPILGAERLSSERHDMTHEVMPGPTGT